MRHFCLHRLGSFVQWNSIRLLPIATLALILLCAAIRSAKLDSDLTSWIQRTPRVNAELNYIDSTISIGQGSSSQLLLQTPQEMGKNILTVDAMMVHLEALAIATHVTVDLYDVSWSLKDICFTPTIPEFDGLHMGTILENIMPCVIKTPLDCFWEGAKLLGPEQPAAMGSFGPNLKWTSLNPKFMVETMQRTHPNSLYPYSALIDWMKRVGINTGYQLKPCLDPSDPGCPPTAPNKFTNQAPNVAAQLTGGCRGFASNQMHWKEEELIGGLRRNKSGYITHADAIQSTLLVMGEQDLYDYWRKTSKVQDIHNWSVDKAKQVINQWQGRFDEELAQFSDKYHASSSFKINTLTSKSMLDPVDESSLTDYNNFIFSFILMTTFTCVVFPKFRISKQPHENSDQKIDNRCPHRYTSQFATILLAIVMSLYVGLTFIASLGLSSFFNLPFNMATTQILPPLATYYGFNQFVMIANIYSMKFGRVKWDSLTTDCLHEIFPIIMIESITYTIALLVAGLIPVQATRMFAFQAITFIMLMTLVSFTIAPSILIAFLTRFEHDIDDRESSGESKIRERSRKRKTDLKASTKTNDYNIEEQIFSRIREDLRNIQADNRRAGDFKFSAHLEANGLHTSLHVLPYCNGLVEHQSPLEKSTSNDEKLGGIRTNTLPDLITSSVIIPNISTEVPETEDSVEPNLIEESLKKNPEHLNEGSSLVILYARCITSNRLAQIVICFISIVTLVAMLSFAPKVHYGLQLRDIIARDSKEYEPLVIQGANFPIYNIFMITKGNFDYPANQRLLHELYQSIERVDGVLRDEDDDKPKFWLAAFRDWLIELQDNYDLNKNRSLTTGEGWAHDVSDITKLAYKLLAQTGRSENSVDKSIVDSNRLIDSDGIINQRGFYYYLTAWVMTDAFSYASTQAMLKPEPKVWNDNPDDLKIEKARPIMYAQIPFLISLPEDHTGNNLRVISEIRRISQTFDSTLPNFPTGIPFIFWDQFLSLDFLFFGALAVAVILIFVVIGTMTSDFVIAAISVIPLTTTSSISYGLLGYLSIPFNNILAVLLITSVGIAMIQTVHLTSVSFSSGI